MKLSGIAFISKLKIPICMTYLYKDLGNLLHAKLFVNSSYYTTITPFNPINSCIG